MRSEEPTLTYPNALILILCLFFDFYFDILPYFNFFEIYVNNLLKSSSTWYI